MIFDLHCDTVYEIRKQAKEEKPISLKKSNLQVDEEKLKNGDYLAQCFAMWVHANNPDPYCLCNEMIDTYYQQLEKCDSICPAFSYADILKNNSQGKISSILTMEDAGPVGEDINRIREFYDRGVRMICLLWNYENFVGYPTSNMNKGITRFGIEAVKEMNKTGIIVDVSHLSDAGFYDVIEYSSKPVVASHSNSRAVCNHARNLTDDMIKKIALSGGVIGMNCAAQFLHNDKEKGRQTFERFAEHMKHIKRIAGCDCLALGSDFDGISPDIELCDASKMSLIASVLEKSGFTGDEIDKITHKNAMRVFKECVG